MMASFSLLPALLLLLAGPVFTDPRFSQAAEVSSEMRPLTASPELRLSLLYDTRRRLGSFQICALCTCCGGPKGLCLPSPCCYAITCNIPNRPFGFCSFLPKTCNCFGCHL